MALGRFNGIDKMVAYTYNTTPYHFGANNLVFFSDPSGLLTTLSNWLNTILDHSEGENTMWSNDGGGFFVSGGGGSSGGAVGFGEGGNYYSYGEYNTYFANGGNVANTTSLPGVSVFGGSDGYITSSKSIFNYKVRIQVYATEWYPRSFWGEFAYAVRFLVEGVSGNSGSTMYGRGGNDLSRRGDGEIYGTWHYDEMMTLGGGGGQITGWKHLANKGDDVVEMVQFVTGVHGQVDGLKDIGISNNQMIKQSITLTTLQYIHNASTKSHDSVPVTNTFTGERAQIKADSTKQNEKLQWNNTQGWNWEN